MPEEQKVVGVAETLDDLEIRCATVGEQLDALRSRLQFGLKPECKASVDEKAEPHEPRSPLNARLIGVKARLEEYSSILTDLQRSIDW